MAFSEKSLDDYIDVAQRIADFREQYPEGTLQPADPAEPFRIMQVMCDWCRQCIGRRVVKENKTAPWKQCPRCVGSGLRGSDEPTFDVYIVYRAAAYRTPDDQRPGIGIAWEPYPGQTTYTAQSELMNAETSAWGRAIIAVGASDSKRGIASREEVRNRSAEREDGLPVNRDGSLSRSRTTDEQKAAAGVMTAGQLAEHTALRPKPAELGPVQHLRAVPDDDPYYVPRTGAKHPGERDYSSPKTITKGQRDRMFGLYEQAFPGASRERRLADTALALGLDGLASWSDLSHDQADTLIKRLETRTAAKT